MNMIQIKKRCENIYNKDFKDKGMSQYPFNEDILNAIMHIYAETVIDYEEVIWLWVKFLKCGVLDVEAAITMARMRIDRENR